MFARLFMVVLLAVAQPVAARAPDTIPQAAARLLFDAPGVSGTRAVVLMQKGRIVAEQYAPGFDASTRLISWSMAKSITSTMIGILIDQKKLSLDQFAPIPAWQKSGDPRGKITIAEMLHMSSGLQHQESGDAAVPIEQADTTQFLFGRAAADFVAAASAKPLESPPGTQFEYSTATSVLLGFIAGNVITAETDPQKRRLAIAAWLARNIFEPAGMPSAVAEFDGRGNFLGGSLVHATARDWANFGQTYLNNGIGPAGKRVVSQAWVKYVQKPSETDTTYGAHFWLNTQRTGKPSNLFPEYGPPDAYAAIGHLGQYVVIVPSRQLVVVRLGKTPDDQLDAVQKSLGLAVRQLTVTTQKQK